MQGAKQICNTTTSEVLSILNGSWKKQITPIHRAREFLSTPVVGGVAWLIYQGAIKGDWDAVSMTIGILENMGYSYFADMVCRIVVLCLEGRNSADSSDLLDMFVGGGFNPDSTTSKIYSSLWRILIPALIVGLDAGEFELGAEFEESSEDGALPYMTALGIGAGVAAGVGLVLDNSAKTVNYLTDLTYSFFKKRNSGYQPLDEDYLEEDLDLDTGPAQRP